MSDDWTQAEIVRTLTRIETKVDGLAANYLPRSEWEMWKDERDREIKELKARSAPWWTWASVLIAAGSLAAAIIPKLA